MAKAAIFSGGCLCGNVRYTARDPINAGYCHCRLCQRSSGAPVLAWATFPIASFAYAMDEPRSYRSSPRGLREFCGRCGTQIAFRGEATPAEIDLNIATLDDPASIEPEFHTWIGTRIPWLHIEDDLPRYTDEGPDRPTS
jgi:hypothetical protein